MTPSVRRNSAVNAAPKNLLIGFLALTTVSASALAWQQYRKLRSLQVTSTLASTERAEWQKRVWDAEKRAAPPPAAEPSALVAGPDSPLSADAQTEAPRAGGGRGNQMATLLNNPDFVRAMALQQKAALDGRYADLFRRLKLSPDQVNRLKDLLVERQSVGLDVMAVAREQGLDGRNSRDQLRTLMQEGEAAVNGEIQSLLGAEGYAAYQSYEQTQPQRNVVDQLQTRLSYSAAPLSEGQSDQLVRILAATSPASGNRGGGGLGALNVVAAAGRGGAGIAQVAGMAVGATAAVTDASVAQAQAVLAPAQVEALKQIQAEQQAQRQLSEALRNGGRVQTP